MRVPAEMTMGRRKFISFAASTASFAVSISICFGFRGKAFDFDRAEGSK